MLMTSQVNIDTVDGSEIRHPPVEGMVVEIPLFTTVFFISQPGGWEWDFFYQE